MLKFNGLHKNETERKGRAMKKVINNAVYDTGTATFIGSFDNGYLPGDFSYYEETLYRTKSGKYFLHGEGGANSRYGEWHGNSGGSGEKIMPMSYDDAAEWAQKNMDGDDYIKAFGDPEDCENVRVLLVLSPAARNKLDKMRSESGQTLSEIIEGLIMAERTDV